MILVMERAMPIKEYAKDMTAAIRERNARL